MIQLLIVDDHPIVRAGLIQLFAYEPDIVVSGKAENGAVALSLIRGGVPCQVVLTDLNMPEIDGIELTKTLTAEFPEISVILLTMHAKEGFAEKAMEAGAKAFVLKDTEAEELIGTVRTVAARAN
ncbi:response regulator [Pedobacter faecalis]|uniref:response regulator n=1 Tax=Pedobacter faecalis TaxID=3041495 RepID=UPI00254B1585|nr:response regulator transcription factor [Pedobacter sp. ELA7]